MLLYEVVFLKGGEHGKTQMIGPKHRRNMSKSYPEAVKMHPLSKGLAMPTNISVPE